MTKPRKVSDIKNQPTSRIPTKPPVDPGKQRSSRELLISKSKQLDLRKTTVAENSRAGNPAGDKRKFGCIENLPDRSKGQKAASVTSGVSQILTSKCRTEECKKIIKNIMSDNRFVDTGEKKRSSAEFEDSLETFNSEEMTDFLLGDVPVRSPETGKLNCETDKSSKRNSSEFDDSIGSFFSDQMVLTMSKSNEFINMTGSKQSFLNENPLGLSYPEGLDNLTPGLSGLSNPVDRTPSGEDLPMECEVEPESGNSAVPGPSEATTSRRYTSPAEELPQESLSSRTSNAPMSIITSITSIMSLDTGYQGDGELSRPESRNTENESRLLKLPIAENGLPVKGINFDDGKTMTDSDFFTESDVDVHDDLSAAAAEIGSGKGDRKAQVIDGTLYGGAFIQSHVTAHNVNENVASVSGQQSSKLVLATNNSNEDMESSGIYSDLERKPEEIRLKEKESISCMNMITEQIKTIQSLAQSVAQKRLRHGPSADGIVKRCSTQDSVSTVYEELHATAPPAGQQSVNRTVGQSETSNSVSVLKNPPNKKPKIYNRTVLKNSLFSMGRENLKKEPEVGVKAVKRGKWDSVMNKIAQGKEENKHAPSKFRDVKSKVFENMGPTINAKRITSDKKVPGKMSPGSQLKSRRLVFSFFSTVFFAIAQWFVLVVLWV
ncbi:hypothetical protein RUM44_011891 [Polyplax serrata]|uniref:Uncharacterized protein n=1 Tax=Polyplax serrata TaxID=468196 RepID=A0ABR1BE76_POLSC